MAINIENVSVLSRYFLIASGSSTTQVSSLADELDMKLSEKGVTPLRVEGAQSALWIILDYGEVMVHIFHRDTREFYNLERLWADGGAIPAEQLLGGGAPAPETDG